MTQWENGICNEKSGFLFSHRCDRMPREFCSKCTKPICFDHTHRSDTDVVVCTSCAKRQQRNVGDRPVGRRDSRHGYYDDDPYFYGPMYGGYGHRHGGFGHAGREHDPHDFTEADSESLNSIGDDEFETDMTES